MTKYVPGVGASATTAHLAVATGGVGLREMIDTMNGAGIVRPLRRTMIVVAGVGKTGAMATDLRLRPYPSRWPCVDCLKSPSIYMIRKR
jgi:hypothetical protein